MMLSETNRPTLEGALNKNMIVADETGQLFLQREPKQNPAILDSIRGEYTFIGFIPHGGSFRRRSTTEQTQFAQLAVGLGLRVLAPAAQEGEIAYYPFLEDAQTLDEFLPNASPEDAFDIVQEIFGDLKKAHTLGLTYGDRWSHNMLIDPQNGFVHVDFDLELGGESAVTFEVAQAAYYALSGGKDKVISILAKVLDPQGWFDMKLFEEFMRGHAAYFTQKQSKYGGINQEVEMLLAMIKSYHKLPEGKSDGRRGRVA